MKITRCSKIQSLIPAGALSIALCFVSPVSAEVHSYILDFNGKGLTDLGTLGGGFTHAYEINDAGQVIGVSATAAGAKHAFITGPNGVGMLDLGALGGNFSDAFGINDAGQIVGVSTTAAGTTHAFITGPNGLGMLDLGVLGGNFSHAFGINDAGQAVGSSTTTDAGDDVAFIAGPNGVGVTDLNSLVDLPTGLVLERARDINNEGQIIAEGFLPIPEPQSYALILVGLILVGFMARRNLESSRSNKVIAAVDSGTARAVPFFVIRR
jgi:probable HAF family extracellular repeat protein